jgi:phosphate/sulfate permease
VGSFDLVALLALSVFFALNMGGSTMAPAFGVALGARLLGRRTAIVLFCVFLIAGSLALGRLTATTLSRDIVPPGTLDERTTLIAVGAAAAALFLANALSIPQSTVWVTVFALTAVGLERGNLIEKTLLLRFFPVWIALPLASFVATTALTRVFYPLRGWNYRLYEHLQKHTWKLRALVIASSCYVAFAAGGNNVANVVGPLEAARVLDATTAFLIMAPVYGFGGVLFRAPTKTVGHEIVPLGLFSASICNLVTGSLIIVASLLKVSQSLVQVNMAAVLAVSFVKDGGHLVLRHRKLWRVFALWFVTPLIALALTWILLVLLA